jgi:hypothetical protein
VFSAAVFGYPLKKHLYRIILLGALLATSSMFVRSLPIKMGFNAFIEIPLFLVLTGVILRLKPIKTVFFIISSFIILAIGESVSYPLVSYISGFTIKQLTDNFFFRFLTGWTHLALIILLTLVLYKKRIYISWFSAKQSPKEARNQLVLTSLLVGQGAIAGLFTFTMYSSVYGGWPVFQSNVFTTIAGGALLVMFVFSGYVIKRMFRIREQAAVMESYESFLDSINKLFTTVRGQRHDFIHHVQVIYSMFKTKENEELDQYLNNLLEEIHIVNESIKVKNPVLNALLNSKTALAEARNVTFEVKIQADALETKMKPLDMVKVLGNLIDNAMDVAHNQPVNRRKVKVSILKMPKVHIFEVANLGPVLSQEVMESIFKSGYTTKENHSDLGLAIVKGIVESYRGKISVRSNVKDGTVFTVMIPD